MVLGEETRGRDGGCELARSGGVDWSSRSSGGDKWCKRSNLVEYCDLVSILDQ